MKQKKNDVKAIAKIAENEFEATGQPKDRLKQFMAMSRSELIAKCLCLDIEVKCLKKAEEDLLQRLYRNVGINLMPGYSDMPNGVAKVIPLSPQNSRKRGTFLKI